MFDLATKRLTWISVEFKMTESDGDGVGRPVTKVVEMLVDLVDKDRFQELFVRPDEVEEAAAAIAYDAVPELDRVKAVVHDWRKVASNGVPAPFNDANLTALLKVPNFSAGFNVSYARAWTGREAVGLGNSERSSVNGSASPAESAA